jgi:hypothetical protein
LSLFTRCVTWSGVGTVRALIAFLALWTIGAFSTRFALFAWFTRLAWLTWFAGFLRGLLVRSVVMRCVIVLSSVAVVGVFCGTFFTWCAVTTLAAVTTVAVT